MNAWASLHVVVIAVSAEAVALAGVISGAVVGLVGTLGVILNTWVARRYEREARIWEARSKAYERLLWYAHRTMLDVKRTYPLKGPAWGKPLGLLPDPEYLEITAAVAAFGTRRVLQALEEFSAKAREFFARAKEKEADEEAGAKVDPSEFESLRQEVDELLERLEELVQAELEHRRPEREPTAGRTDNVRQKKAGARRG